MYRCQNCKNVVTPGTKMNRVVVETRPRSYSVFRALPARRKDRDPVRELVATTSGHEIARELITCPACARELRQQAVCEVAPRASAR